MSQPHPPIPEPQPHPAPGPDGLQDDDPRTQSILLPPSQRPAEQPADAVPGWAQPPAQHTTAWSAPSAPPGSSGQPQTNELPVASDPTTHPQTGQFPAQPAHDPADGVHQTERVDWMPGFSAPGPASPRPAAPGAAPAQPAPDQPPSGPQSSGSTAATLPPPPGPATAPGAPTATASTGQSTGHRRNPLAAVQGTGRGGAALLPLLLGAVALVLLELGLSRDYGSRSLWEVVPTWSVFATLAALVALVPAVARLAGRRLPARTAWRVGAAGVAGLAAFWVLVALPLAASDRGFWLTAALGAAAGALWLTPGRAE